MAMAAAASTAQAARCAVMAELVSALREQVDLRRKLFAVDPTQQYDVGLLQDRLAKAEATLAAARAVAAAADAAAGARSGDRCLRSSAFR